VLRATWFILAGMGIVFATLALLVLVLAALNRVLGAKPAAKAGPGERTGRA
jgi:Na+-transporting methylmalonyl-CoA/oxaloacetate decarboxylase gamma subunit